MTLHDLSPEQVSKFQVLYQKEEKKLLIAYLLLIFAGGLGAHELYSKEKQWFSMRWSFLAVLFVGIFLTALVAESGIKVLVIIISIVTGIGFVGSMVVAIKTLVDYFTLPKKLRAINQDIEDEIILELKGKAADDFMAGGSVEESASAPVEHIEEVVEDTAEIVEQPTEETFEPVAEEAPVEPPKPEIEMVDTRPEVEEVAAQPAEPVEPVVPVEPAETFEPIAEKEEELAPPNFDLGKAEAEVMATPEPEVISEPVAPSMPEPPVAPAPPENPVPEMPQPPMSEDNTPPSPGGVG